MTRVCSWCRRFLAAASAGGGGRPTHGICPRCLLSVLEELETIASRHSPRLPGASWLIVVGPDDAALLRELERRFSQSRLVDVIRDRRAGASPSTPSSVAPLDRRDSQDDPDRHFHGFFVVYRPRDPFASNGSAP